MSGSTTATAPAAAPVTAPASAPITTPTGPAAADAKDKLFGNYADGPTGGVAAPPAAAAAAAMAPKAKTVADYTGGLDKTIDKSITTNRAERFVLDGLKKKGDAGAGASEKTLNDDRRKLLGDLKERSGAYNADIKKIDDQLGGKIPKNPTPEQKKLLADKQALMTGRDKYSDQQTSLQRWDDRNTINDINSKLANPNLDPKEKTALLAQKRTLATGLLSTTKHYEQFDSKWGETTYGGKGFTTMREAGCGPTALADLMDFKDQEDPEGQHSRGVKDPYDPRKMADYATNHGRVKGSGTDGSRMFRDLNGSFSGVQGNDLGSMAKARESLENGMPVAILGHNISGQGANGKTASPYGGHFMVLNGVSQDGSNYTVQDGGRNQSRNIHTMTNKQLNAGSVGYWNVTDH